MSPSKASIRSLLIPLGIYRVISHFSSWYETIYDVLILIGTYPPINLRSFPGLYVLGTGNFPPFMTGISPLLKTPFLKICISYREVVHARRVLILAPDSAYNMITRDNLEGTLQEARNLSRTIGSSRVADFLWDVIIEEVLLH